MNYQTVIGPTALWAAICPQRSPSVAGQRSEKLLRPSPSMFLHCSTTRVMKVGTRGSTPLWNRFIDQTLIIPRLRPSFQRRRQSPGEWAGYLDCNPKGRVPLSQPRQRYNVMYTIIGYVHVGLGINHSRWLDVVSASVPENCRAGQTSVFENVKQDDFECAVDGIVSGPRPSVQISDHPWCTSTDRCLVLLCAALTRRIFYYIIHYNIVARQRINKPLNETMIQNIPNLQYRADESYCFSVYWREDLVPDQPENADEPEP